MARHVFLGVLVCCGAFACLRPASGQDTKVLKPKLDKTANWLIDQHQLGQASFGKGKQAAHPGLLALVLKSLAEMPRKYRESHAPSISEPAKAILAAQQASGAFAAKDGGRETYTTALAVQALEALKNPKHAAAIEKGRDYLLTCQNKDGGFGYAASQNQGSDLSNTYFALAGLHSAAYKKSEAAFKSAVGFIRACQDNPETNPDPAAKKGEGTGGAYYKPGLSDAGTVKTREGAEVPKPYGSMTAAALDGLVLCGLSADAPEVRAAAGYFSKLGSVKENPGLGQKGYFYYAMSASRALKNAGVTEWTLPDGTKSVWFVDLAQHLLAVQKEDGSFVNSEGQWLEDDPIICTAYALQALTVCNDLMAKAEAKKAAEPKK